MQNPYSLKALDDVVTVTLNPYKNPVDKLTEIEIRIIEDDIIHEFQKIESSLMEVFSLKKENKIHIIIDHYHQELITLVNQIYKNRSFFPAENKLLNHAYHTMISCLDELISFIEIRFSVYVSLNKKVPITYLIVSKEELRLKMESLRIRLLQIVPIKEYAELVINTIDYFINTPAEDLSITFKEVLYMKELVSKLEILDDPVNPKCVYTALTEMLVSLNFNNKIFINFFTRKVKEQILPIPSLEEQHEQLAFKRKEFQQMHEQPGVCFDPLYPGLKVEVDRWFKHEISYVEEKMKLAKINFMNQPKIDGIQKADKFKILCTISGDQIGLLLRALDQNRVIIATSLTSVFRNIVPYLSTKDRIELSPESTRSKSYESTEKDKLATIDMLEKLIMTIKDF